MSKLDNAFASAMSIHEKINLRSYFFQNKGRSETPYSLDRIAEFKNTDRTEESVKSQPYDKYIEGSSLASKDMDLKR